MQQGTAEWRSVRAGKVTGSRINDVLAEGRKGEAATRIDYKTQLALERLTGIVRESYVSPDMLHGTLTEDEAKLCYELETGKLIANIAFVEHPYILLSGCSPDGLIEDQGLVEFKCPKTSTHLDTFFYEKIPCRYKHQMQWQMACTGRQWCDFVSYDPRLPGELQLKIIRVSRDDTLIDLIERNVIEFLGEVQNLFEKLKAKCNETNWCG